MDADVIVVGAGLSGLMAAWHLLKKHPGLNVQVLEAKDRVGGRTLTVDMVAANGTDRWDLGGQWVGKTQPHVLQLAQELGLELYPQYIQGRKYQQVGGHRISSYKSDIPALSWYSLIQLHLFMTKIDKLSKRVKSSNPMEHESTRHLDSVTLEQFVNQHLSSQGARDAVAAAGRCMFGVEPSQMSVLYYLLYANAAGGIEALISAKENIGGQQYKITGGAQQLSELLMQKVGGQKVLLDKPVVAIEQEEDRVSLTTVEGRVYTCRRVVMAIPPHQAAKIQYSPALPSDKLHVFERMPVGHLIKIIVTYKSAFWRENGESGEICTNGGPSVLKECDTGPLCIVFDATSSYGNPALVGFIGGDQALQYHGVSADDRRRAVLHSLSQFFGDQAQAYLDYAEKDWHNEPYNGGCPVDVGTPGVMTFFAGALRDPFRNLHFAGTESATVWCGFLNGAIQAGVRAANEVLYQVKPEAVTRQDMVGTYYDPQRPDRRVAVASKSGSGLTKWVLGLGVVSLCAFAAVRFGYIKYK